MAIARSEAGEALTLDGLPADDAAADGLPEAQSGVLGRLRAAWTDYVAENRKGWDRIVDEQAKDPSLD